MPIVTKLKSGLTIEQCGNKVIVSKGNQSEVYGSMEAATRALTAGLTKPKRKKAKPAKHAATAAAKPRKAKKAKKAKPAKKAHKAHKAKRNAVGQAVKANGHKFGCKCLACSPETRKKALASRKRKAGKAKAQRDYDARAVKRPVKARKPSQSRKSRTYHASYPSVADALERRRPGRPRRPVTAQRYYGDMSRFDRPRPVVHRMPPRLPYGYLPPGRN